MCGSLCYATRTWAFAGCTVARPAEQTATPRQTFQGGCSSGRALSERPSSKQTPGKCSSPPSDCTWTNFRTDTERFLQLWQPSECVTHQDFCFTPSAHLSVSISQWGLPRPPHRFWTPTSRKTLSERSRDFSLLEAELITEARILEHFSVRLQLRRLDTHTWKKWDGEAGSLEN